MSYLSNKHKNISEALPEDIEHYLNTGGYFTEEGIIPGSINPDGMGAITIPGVNWTARTLSIPRTQSIDILLEKPDKGIRRFSLVHPYIYKLLVKEVVENVDTLRDRLLRTTSVDAYSIPRMFMDDDITQDWKYFSKVDPAEHLSNHPFIVRADISNFYESIYTHSISWAIHGAEAAKGRSRDYTLLGNRLDKLFQNARDGQTNGIPTGNTISDMAAELVLKDIDEAISETIERHDIRALRYRDDYLFMCKNKNDARKILDRLSLELSRNHGFALNQAKVKFYTADEYVSSLVSTKISTELPPGVLAENCTLRGEELLDYIHQLKIAALKSSSKSFDAGVKRLIDRLKLASMVIVDDSFPEWALLLIRELVDAIEVGASSSSVVYLLIDQILSESGDAKSKVIGYIINTTKGSPNVMRKIWVYALLRKYAPDLADGFASSSDESLLTMALLEGDQVSHFVFRDTPSNDVVAAIAPLSVIRIDIFDEIGEEAMIWSILESDYYDGMLRSHYDA